MTLHHQPLWDKHRAAFSALMINGRVSAGLSLEAAANRTSDVLDNWRMPGHGIDMLNYVRWSEGRPPQPLASPHRLSSLLLVYQLSWHQVLEVIGVDRSVIFGDRENGDHQRHGRRVPYTNRGVARLPCYRCGVASNHQWQFLADGGLFRPLCVECDAALNEIVLRFVGCPDVTEKMRLYRQIPKENTK